MLLNGHPFPSCSGRLALCLRVQCLHTHTYLATQHPPCGAFLCFLLLLLLSTSCTATLASHAGTSTSALLSIQMSSWSYAEMSAARVLRAAPSPPPQARPPVFLRGSLHPHVVDRATPSKRPSSLRTCVRFDPRCLVRALLPLLRPSCPFAEASTCALRSPCALEFSFVRFFHLLLGWSKLATCDVLCCAAPGPCARLHSCLCYFISHPPMQCMHVRWSAQCLHSLVLCRVCLSG